MSSIYSIFRGPARGFSSGGVAVRMDPFPAGREQIVAAGGKTFTCDRIVSEDQRCAVSLVKQRQRISSAGAAPPHAVNLAASATRPEV